MRDGTYYDLGLATIYVAHGTTAITNAMITDTRFNTSVCGQVYNLAENVDTTSLFAQYDAKLTQLIEDMGESEHVDVITSYSIHYTKLYEPGRMAILLLKISACLLPPML